MRQTPRHGLFGAASLPDEAKSRGAEAVRAVDAAPVDDLLAHDVDALVDHFAIDFGTVAIDWTAVSMTEPRPIATAAYTDAFGQSVLVPQVRSTVSVPIDGDPLTLTYRSHSGAPSVPIDATITRDALQLTWTGHPDDGPALIRTWFDAQRRDIERYVFHNLGDIDGLNTSMRARIRTAIERRRTNELNRRDLAAALPFPISRKPSASVPVQARRAVRLHLGTDEACSTFEPEPALERAVYDEIFEDLVNQATVLERTQLGGWNEEQIRNLLMAQLNTNYTGQVAGELFNGAGKTDILIRQADRNVFVGECKFYDGPKSVAAAVDQILGYLVWRDTKAAILMFARGGQFGDMVGKSVDAVAGHPRCIRVVPARDPSRRSDYLFARADDPGRSIHLSLLPFRLLA